MEKRSYISSLKSYLRLNWFKLSLLGLLVFVFLRKDFSFQLHLNKPDSIEQSLPQDAGKTSVKQKHRKGELLTQRITAQKPLTNNATITERMEIPFFGSSNSVANSAEAELAKVDAATRKAYIQRFANVAVSERKKYGIPSSIILANAILHSIYGQRDLALKGNNHFGLPCTVNWRGPSGTYNDACYRHYENAWASFRDHSLYLTSGKYAPLRKLSPTDYKAWAQSLEQAGYSDIYDNLANRLVVIIENQELYAFDYQ